MLVANDFDGIAPILTPELTAEGIQIGLLLDTGSLLSYTILDGSVAQGMAFLEVEAIHTQGRAVLTVVSGGGVISGIWLQSFDFLIAQPDVTATFTAESITVGESTAWPLDGILTIPDSASASSPVPAVILVHGSGPQNMDLSIFDNRPFWDIAEVLSTNGIAVLRYDKRTHAHGHRFVQTFGDHATVWDEAIEDAVLAAEILQADERIGNVYVLGLSLGGMLAPKIAEEAGLDGAILLAGSPRPLYEIQFDQNLMAVLAALEEGEITFELADIYVQFFEEQLASAEIIPHLFDFELVETTVFGIPALYHLSILHTLPLPLISESDRRVLILQGDRDFQVLADTDFHIFESYTADMEHVTTILYEGINHLFMRSQTQYNDLRDYMPPGRVDPDVLRDIVEWILD